MKPSSFALLIVALVFASGSSAFAVRESTLIDAELKRVPVRFVSLDGDRLTYFASARRLTTVKSDTKLTLRCDRDANPAPGSPPAAPPPAPT
ncbi:MAG: hypothetical protein H8E63_03955, partial [Proteobacteria bacterium]|nr:hypothetical protein [Pseudomonadota bacterium]